MSNLSKKSMMSLGRLNAKAGDSVNVSREERGFMSPACLELIESYAASLNATLKEVQYVKGDRALIDHFLPWGKETIT